MILRSIRAEGLGCFADPVAVGPFEPGINIVHAPNGTGKTTLFRAVSLATIEAHRSKAADIQALRPWGRRLSPYITIEFEHSGKIYRLRKHFLDGASAHLETKDGDGWTAFAQGDSADEFVRELLRIGTEKARAAKPEHWGIGQVLWTTQGDLALPGLAPSVVDYIRSSVGAQLTGKGSSTEAAVEREYLKYFSPTAARLKTGKGAVPQVRLAAERDRLMGEQQTAEDLLQQFETESTRIEQLRNEAAAHNAERDRLAAELARWQDSVGTYDRLTSERAQKSALRDEANSRQKGLRERIATIEGCRRQLTNLENQLAVVDASVPAAKEKREIAAIALHRAELDLSHAVKAEQEAHLALAEAQLAQEYIRAQAQSREIEKRLADVALAQSHVQKAAEQLTGWCPGLS
jgi:DNA repair exonuclease SbcCD ATPase subunit